FRPEHWEATKRVLRYLCSTSGMGFVLGGWGSVVLTGHADASWELRWLTYLLTDLGERPRSPPILYIDSKVIIALCHEHRLEHRTKHIALRYFLARELQQRGQLRRVYMATRAKTVDIFTKALQSDMMEKFFSFMSFYEQHQQGAPAQSNNSNNNATPMSLDGSSYARGNQQQRPTFAPYEPQRGSASFMPHPQPASGQEKTLDALQVQSQFAHVLKLQTTRPFNGKDFFTWSFEFELIMEGAQILGFFDGSLPYPTHGTQYDKQQYTYQSMMAYTILLRNITPSQQQNIRSNRGYGNSAELAYNHLKSLYQATDSVNQSRLMAQLTTVEMKPGEKGMAYISRCRELRDKLLRCGGSISEDAFVTVIIGGLGPQWRSTRAILRAHGKISEAALCAEIHAEQQDMDLQEERHRKKTSVPEFAFHTQRRYNNNNYQHQPKLVPPFCHLCKTSGHPRTHCPNRQQSEPMQRQLRPSSSQVASTQATPTSQNHHHITHRKSSLTTARLAASHFNPIQRTQPSLKANRPEKTRGSWTAAADSTCAPQGVLFNANIYSNVKSSSLSPTIRTCAHDDKA
ncbi:unnamed protein product, partial [Closterium sp. NIES-54]